MPIVHLENQKELRDRILAGRDAGDKRWQQKWDDLDAFPYGAPDGKQEEWMRDHPVLGSLLKEVADERLAAAQKSAPAPAPARGRINTKIEGPAPRPTGLHKWLPKDFAD